VHNPSDLSLISNNLAREPLVVQLDDPALFPEIDLGGASSR
jgi:hypothetical protein